MIEDSPAEPVRRDTAGRRANAAIENGADDHVSGTDRCRQGHRAPAKACGMTW